MVCRMQESVFNIFFATHHFADRCNPVNHQVYGTGSAHTLALAKEKAAEEAYHNLRMTYNIGKTLFTYPIDILS